MTDCSRASGPSDVARAILVYAQDDPPPDLAIILQFLLDDLRAEGAQVDALSMTDACGAQLAFDQNHLAVTRIESPTVRSYCNGVMRPVSPSGMIHPDALRSRLARWLVERPSGLLVAIAATPHSSALDAKNLRRARAARLCLLPVLEAAPPRAVVWQPSALLLAPDDVWLGGAECLLAQPDPDSIFILDGGKTRNRPASKVRPVHPREIRPRPHTRAQRAARRSAGRLFGTLGLRGHRPLPRPDRALARLAAALRSETPHRSPCPAPARPAQAYAVAAQWIVLLPHLIGTLLPYT